MCCFLILHILFVPFLSSATSSVYCWWGRLYIKNHYQSCDFSCRLIRSPLVIPSRVYWTMESQGQQGSFPHWTHGLLVLSLLDSGPQIWRGYICAIQESFILQALTKCLQRKNSLSWLRGNNITWTIKVKSILKVSCKSSMGLRALVDEYGPNHVHGTWLIPLHWLESWAYKA